MSRLDKIVFKRGDKVDYLPSMESSKKYKPINRTFIWALWKGRYIIQHPSGLPKINSVEWKKDNNLLINQLKDGLKYISADASELKLSTPKPFELAYAKTTDAEKKEESAQKIVLQKNPKLSEKEAPLK